MSTRLHFVLKSKEEGKPTSIFLRFKKSGVRFVWSLGRDRMIDPILWNERTQRPSNTRDALNESERGRVKYLLKKQEDENPDIKIELENIKNRIENVGRDVRGFIARIEEKDEVLDYDELKEYLSKKYTPSKSKTKTITDEDYKTFLTPYYELFVQGIARGTILKDSGRSHGQRYAYETVRTYWNTLDHWKGFEGHLGRKIRWSEVNSDLYDSFILYCNKENLSANYIGKLVKNLKVILRRAYDKGIHSNEEFKRSYFKVLKLEVTKIALTENELERIRLLDLSHDAKNYELYRDVFLVGCYTAQRFSDFSRIRPEHVKGDYIDIITQKTNKRVVIPIRPELRQILNKYHNSIPKTYRQDVNDAIKEIGKMAGINEMMEYEKVKGGKVVRGKKPKYAMIETHTARRTGATLMYLATNDSLGVMKITGHTTEKNFLKYIKIDIEKNAERMKESRFFSPLKKVK